MALVFNLFRGLILLIGTTGFFITWYIIHKTIKQEFDIPIAYVMLNVNLGMFYLVFLYSTVVKFSPYNFMMGIMNVAVLILFYIYVMLETQLSTGC